MNRSIRRRLYLIALMPLATLAIGLIAFNGYTRISDATEHLQESRRVTTELLYNPAVEALVIGNTLTFEQLVSDLHDRTNTIRCISLRDLDGVTVTQAGACPVEWSSGEIVAIEASGDGLSDFPSVGEEATVVGELRVSMRDEPVTQKIRQILIQLAIGLLLVAIVSYVISRLIQARLVKPISQIDEAMRAVSHRQYDTRVNIQGDDELGRLSESVNSTINTIQSYTRELTESKDDAERALYVADEAFMAKHALVRSLTEDLAEPIGIMHSALAAIAIANADPKLKESIKSVMALLQDAEANLADLVAIATTDERPRDNSRPRDLGEIMANLERDLGRLSKADDIDIHFAVSQTPLHEARTGEPTGIYIKIDGVRFKKALIHIIRALAKHCKAPGIYVTAEFIKLDEQRLNVSVNLKAYYDKRDGAPGSLPLDIPIVHTQLPPPILGWTDRETKVIGYLLRALDITPVFSISPLGAVNLLLDTTCVFSVQALAAENSTTWMLEPKPLAAIIVTNDIALARLTTRGDISKYDITMMSYAQATSNMSLLLNQDALLIDIGDDIAAAVVLVELLNKTKKPDKLLDLIAICPPGRISDSLGNRLFDLGFRGVTQKPLQYGRVVDVLRSTIAIPLRWIADSPRKE